jgi:hypothetical protein
MPTRLRFLLHQLLLHPTSGLPEESTAALIGTHAEAYVQTLLL